MPGSTLQGVVSGLESEDENGEVNPFTRMGVQGGHGEVGVGEVDGEEECSPPSGLV